MIDYKELFTDISQWLTMTEQEIKDTFKKLPGAVSLGIKDHEDFENIYIPGSRKDRVLLVAHVDTVWKDEGVVPVLHNNFIISGSINRKGKDRGVGIGADDRAGVAMLWKLAGLGHSLLLTGAEEVGCKGARAIPWFGEKEEIKEVNRHQFAIELDRHGSSDAVFYDVGNKKFEKYITSKTKFIKEEGSFTDICILCQEMTGVNLSVGYYQEHTPYELLNINSWHKTLKIVANLLNETEIPPFKIHE